MSLLDSIKGSADRTRHHNLESTLSFPQLDTEGIKRTLRLKDEAERNGAQCLPASDSSDLDSVERSIVTLIDQERDKDLNRYLDHRRTYDDRLQALGLARRAAEIDTEARAGKTRISERVHIGLDWLDQHSDSLRATKEEYRSFRQENKLKRPSHHPKSHKWHIALLIFLFPIEGLLNGKYLAVGDEFGLLGGVMQALIIAGVNIGTALIIGLTLVRQVNHRAWWRKAIGLLSIVAYLGLAFGLNLAVAHYRLALGGETPELAPQLGFASLISDPLGIDDFNSWLLFVIGLLCSFGGLADGLRWDDRYPGYGAVARRRDAAKEEYAAEKEELMEELADSRDEAIKRIQNAATSIQLNLDSHRQFIERRRSLRRSFLSYLDQLESAGNKLLQFYRDENRRVRSSECPAPARFERPWTMTRPSLDEDDGRESILVSPESIRSTLERIPMLASEIISTFEREMARYKLIAEQSGLDDDETKVE